MAMLVLVARDVTFVVVVFTGLLLCRHRGIAMTMFVQIAWHVTLVVVVRTWLFDGLVIAHGLSPVVEPSSSSQPSSPS